MQRFQTMPPARTLAATLVGAASVMVLATPAAHAADQPAPASATASTSGDIVVTARKREESISHVPMSIAAVTGRQLAVQGITRVTDLGRAVPGFTYTTSQVGSPIYTLRGVGFVDISLGGRPTVSVYDDQFPIPFTIETLGSTIDLDHIEVLKGPQGTLFGQNSTGGAINMIAAKPTNTVQAGIDASYGNYNATTLAGFVSGPITDTLSARLAVRHDGMDAWQTSDVTGAHLGVQDLTSGRLLVDWKPTGNLKFELGVNGYVDRSDTPAAQTIAVIGLPGAAALVPALGAYPVAPRNDRAADWDLGQSYRRNNQFVQANLRTDYSLANGFTFTSLTSYSHYSENQPVDTDGTDLAALQQTTLGSISSWYEEARLAGRIGQRAFVTLGGDYSSDSVRETNFDTLSGSTQAFTFVPFGLPLFKDFRDTDNQDSQSWAVFGNVDYNLTDTLKLNGGLRYTRAIDHFNGCSSDSGDGNAASVFGPFFNIVRGSLGLPPLPPIPAGGCVTATNAFVPQLVVNTLDEDNVSWRAGLEWQALPRTLLYANASQGFKAGGFPDLGATAVSQYDPARQESLLAYEAGFKSTLADGTLQLDGAVFYYDYRDKQVLGTVSDPLFGKLLKLINIPRSQITGAELEATWTPIHGLTLSGAASYIDSEILDNFTNFNPFGVQQNFGGEPFPNTPRWQLQGSASYQWPVSDHLDAFIGGDVTYKSATNNALGEAPLLTIASYALVDLNAGVQSRDGTWRATIWGRNIGNTYYWTGAYLGIDTAVRYTGMPATFGISLSYRFRQ
jgi:iron complex outermembrane receptor protein